MSVLQVAVTDDELIAELSDGRKISVPLTWYPRLVFATHGERAKWRLIGRGKGIHWQDLDEDISAAIWSLANHRVRARTLSIHG